MSNVLPSGAQKDAWRFNRSHFVLVGALVLLVGALVALAVLIPGYLLVKAGQEVALPSFLQVPAAKEGNERAEIVRAQVLTEQFSFLASSSTSPIDALAAALRARPSGASIEGIQYIRGEAGKILITGSASNRTSVSAYRDALAKEVYFTDVSIPASALAGAEGGKFSITLTGDF